MKFICRETLWQTTVVWPHQQRTLTTSAQMQLLLTLRHRVPAWIWEASGLGNLTSINWDSHRLLQELLLDCSKHIQTCVRVIMMVKQIEWDTKCGCNSNYETLLSWFHSIWSSSAIYQILTFWWGKGRQLGVLHPPLVGFSLGIHPPQQTFFYESTAYGNWYIGMTNRKRFGQRT